MPSELANLLSAMSHLEKLVFVVPEYHSGLFEEAFRHAELMMPSVDILVVGPYCYCYHASDLGLLKLSRTPESHAKHCQHGYGRWRL